MEYRRHFHCKFPGCAKSFKRKDYLVRHVSIHSNVRPYNCKTCQTSFTRKDLLEKHGRSKAHKNKLRVDQGKSIFVNTFGDGTAEQVDEEQDVDKLNHHSPDLKMAGKFSNFTQGFEGSMNWIFGNSSPGSSPNFDQFLESYDFPADLHNKLVDFDSTKIQPDTVLKLVELLKSLNISSESQSLISAVSSNFFNLYWSSFDSIYPIVHQAVFKNIYSDPSELNLLFLATIITIGVALSSDEIDSTTHSLASEVQSKVRPRLIQQLQNVRNVKQTPLSLLQALALTDFFNLYCGTHSQRVEFQIYHPMIVNLMKEMGLFSERGDPLEFQDLSQLGLESYEDWINYESFKRVALFEYLLDSQMHFFLGKHSCLSVFEVQLNLPCTDYTWCANDLKTFILQYSEQPRELNARNRRFSTFDNVHTRYDHDKEDAKESIIPEVQQEGSWPNFLWSLRRLMQPFSQDQIEYHVNCFSQFSRFIFLHGVLSLVRELRNNYLFDQGSSQKFNSIAAKIEHSFYSWRIYLHSSIAESNASHVSEKDIDFKILNNYDISPAFWANIIMFNIGLLGLYCNFDKLLSELVSISGSRGEKLIPTAYVSSWARSKDGEHSLIQACTLSRTIINNNGIISGVPHAFFAIYVSIMVCWVYEMQSWDLITWKELDVSADTLEENSLKYPTLILEDDKNVRDQVDGRLRLTMLKYNIVYTLKTLKTYTWESSNKERYIEYIESILK